MKCIRDEEWWNIILFRTQIAHIFSDISNTPCRKRCIPFPSTRPSLRSRAVTKYGTLESLTECPAPAASQGDVAAFLRLRSLDSRAASFTPSERRNNGDEPVPGAVAISVFVLSRVDAAVCTSDEKRFIRIQVYSTRGKQETRSNAPGTGSLG